MSFHALQPDHRPPGAAGQQLADMLPAHLHGPVLLHIHHAMADLTAISREVLDYLTRLFMPGERVIATLGDGAPVPAEVVSISSMRTDISPPPRSAKLMRLVQQLPAVEDPAPDGQTLYQLRLPDGQMAQAPGAHLQRYPQVTEAQIQAFVRASTIELAVRGIPNLHRIWAVHPELAQAYGITATIPEAVLAHVVPRQQTGPAPGPRQMVPGPWPVPGPASSGERTAGAPSSSGRGASAGRSAGAPSPNLGASSHGAAAPVRGAASVGARAELLVHEDAGHPRDVRPASELQELLSRYPEGHVKHGIVQVLWEAGEEGMTVKQIVDEMQDQGLRDWPSAKSARSLVTAACGGDPVFTKLSKGRFALSVLAPAVSEPARKKIRSAPNLVWDGVTCPACGQGLDVAGAAAATCPACARGFHPACLGEAPGAWCAHCRAVPSGSQGGSQERGGKKRAAMSGGEDGGEGAQSVGKGGGRTGGRGGGGAARGSGARDAVRDRKLAEARRVSVPKFLEDQEAVREAELDADRLRSHAACCLAEAERLEATAAASGLSADGPVEWPEALLRAPGLPLRWLAQGPGDAVLEEWAEEEGVAVPLGPAIGADPADAAPLAPTAPAVAARLRALAQECTRAAAALSAQACTPPLPPLVADPGYLPREAFEDCVCVAEFTAAFSQALGVRPMRPSDVAQAVLEGPSHPLVGRLFVGLLRVLLQELASKDTSPKGSRVKRWLRILQEAVWPEVFRRAVLFTRGLKDFDPRHFLDILNIGDLPSDTTAVDGEVWLVRTAARMGQAPLHALTATELARALRALCDDAADTAELRAVMDQRLAAAARADEARLRSDAHRRGAGAGVGTLLGSASAVSLLPATGHLGGALNTGTGTGNAGMGESGAVGADVSMRGAFGRASVQDMVLNSMTPAMSEGGSLEAGGAGRSAQEAMPPDSEWARGDEGGGAQVPTTLPPMSLLPTAASNNNLSLMPGRAPPTALATPPNPTSLDRNATPGGPHPSATSGDPIGFRAHDSTASMNFATSRGPGPALPAFAGSLPALGATSAADAAAPVPRTPTLPAMGPSASRVGLSRLSPSLAAPLATPDGIPGAFADVASIAATRTEPLGTDRYFCRWTWLLSEPSCILVQDPEMDPWGVRSLPCPPHRSISSMPRPASSPTLDTPEALPETPSPAAAPPEWRVLTTRAELDAAILSMLVRGEREGPLRRALLARYTLLVAALSPPGGAGQGAEGARGRASSGAETAAGAAAGDEGGGGAGQGRRGMGVAPGAAEQSTPSTGANVPAGALAAGMASPEDCGVDRVMPTGPVLGSEMHGAVHGGGVHGGALPGLRDKEEEYGERTTHLTGLEDGVGREQGSLGLVGSMRAVGQEERAQATAQVQAGWANAMGLLLDQMAQQVWRAGGDLGDLSLSDFQSRVQAIQDVRSLCECMTVIEMAITRLDNRATAVTGAAPDPIDNLTGIALSDRVKDMHPVDAERLSPEWNEVQGGPGADAQGRGAGGGGASGGGGRGASGGASGGGSGGGGSGGAQELARAASPDVGMEWDGSMQDLQGEESAPRYASRGRGDSAPRGAAAMEEKRKRGRRKRRPEDEEDRVAVRMTRVVPLVAQEIDDDDPKHPGKLWHNLNERRIWQGDVAAAITRGSLELATYSAAVLRDRSAILFAYLERNGLMAKSAADPHATRGAAKRAAEVQAPTPGSKRAASAAPPPPPAAEADADAGHWAYHCISCGLGGDLLLCEGTGPQGPCPNCLCMQCARLDHIPSGAWYCPPCLNQPVPLPVLEATLGGPPQPSQPSGVRIPSAR